MIEQFTNLQAVALDETVMGEEAAAVGANFLGATIFKTTFRTGRHEWLVAGLETTGAFRVQVVRVAYRAR